MAEVTTTQKVSVVVVTSLLIAWIMWVSWELYQAKAADKMNTAIAALAQGIQAVDGKLNTEIERSKIKDNSTFDWLRSVSGKKDDHETRITRLETKIEIRHGQ